MNRKPTIFYNAACPICRREIEHYRHLDREAGGALDFADIDAADHELRDLGLSPDTARRRLHVLDGEGRLLAGVPAFAAIWDRLPRYRWLATICRLPLLRSVLPWIYDGIAFCLYRWDKKRRCTVPG